MSEELNNGHCPSCKYETTTWEQRCGKLCRHPDFNKREFWDQRTDGYMQCRGYIKAEVEEAIHG